MAQFSHDLCIVAMVLTLLSKYSMQSPYEKKLINKLLDGYQSMERPVANETEPIIVTFGLTLQQIIDVNEKDQIITSNCWLDVTWHAENLKWDPAEYGNVTDVRIHPKYLWTPDVLMYNSADDTFDATYQTNIVISSDGSCLFVPPGMFKSTCKIDITWFPFDKQECIMKFGSWTYDGTKLDLRLKADSADIAPFIPNGEWDLLEMPATRNVEFYECCPDAPYIDLKFKFVLLRRKLYFMVNLIIPAALLALLTLVTFTIPPDAGEKISFAVTILLSLTVFLLMVAEQLPSTSDAVPLLAVYFGTVMLLCALSVIFTVWVLSYHHRSKDTHAMPRWVKRGICEWLAWLLRMKRPGYDLSRKALSGKKNNNKDNLQLSDKCSRSLLANVVDIDEDNQLIGNGHIAGLNVDIGDHSSCMGTYEMRAILKELRKITEKMKSDEKDGLITADWKFAAMVVDRLLLIIFGIACTVSSAAILMSAPTVFV